MECHYMLCMGRPKKPINILSGCAKKVYGWARSLLCLFCQLVVMQAFRMKDWSTLIPWVQFMVFLQQWSSVHVWLICLTMALSSCRDDWWFTLPFSFTHSQCLPIALPVYLSKCRAPEFILLFSLLLLV